MGDTKQAALHKGHCRWRTRTCRRTERQKPLHSRSLHQPQLQLLQQRKRLDKSQDFRQIYWIREGCTLPRLGNQLRERQEVHLTSIRPTSNSILHSIDHSPKRMVNFFSFSLTQPSAFLTFRLFD